MAEGGLETVEVLGLASRDGDVAVPVADGAGGKLQIAVPEKSVLNCNFRSVHEPFV